MIYIIILELKFSFMRIEFDTFFREGGTSGTVFECPCPLSQPDERSEELRPSASSQLFVPTEGPLR